MILMVAFWALASLSLLARCAFAFTWFRWCFVEAFSCLAIGLDVLVWLQCMQILAYHSRMKLRGASRAMSSNYLSAITK